MEEFNLPSVAYPIGDTDLNFRRKVIENFKEVESRLGAVSQIVISHGNLITARDAKGLAAGAYYVISDFKTIELAHGSTTEIIQGELETLVLTATSTDTFSPIVSSVEHPTDIIFYDVDNVLAEDGTTARKGRITRRTDKNGNSTPWDFRNVKHKMIMLEAPEYNNALEYANGRLVKVTAQGWIYKASNRGDLASPSGNAPIAGSKYWIKYLPIDSPLLLKELLAGARTTNIGTVVNTGVTYGTPFYCYTFSDDIYEENSASFENCVIGDNSSNIVFLPNGGVYSNIQIGANSQNLRFGGSGINVSFPTGASNNIFYGEINNSLLSGIISNNVIGTFGASTVNGIFQGNTILGASTGCNFMSETVYNSIDFINNGYVGSDLWGCRIITLSYFNIGYRCTDSFLGLVTKFTTLGALYNSTIGVTSATNVTIIGEANETIFPDEITNCIIEVFTEYGVSFSVGQIALLSDADHKKVIGDDNAVFVIKRNGSGVEVITL